MKKIICLVLFTVLLSLFSVAQNDTVIPEDETVNAGTTPDHPLWGLDVAFDKLSIALTFNKIKKMEKRLRIADERLEEIKLMVDKRKFSHSEKAKKYHLQLLKDIEVSLDEFDEEDSMKQFEIEVEFEQRVQKHKDRIFDLEVKIKGNLTVDQKAALEQLIAAMGAETSKIEIKIRVRHNRTILKIKEEFGQEQIENLESDRWKRKALHEQGKAQKSIEKAENKIELFEKKLQARFGESITQHVEVSSASNSITGQVTSQDSNQEDSNSQDADNLSTSEEETETDESNEEETDEEEIEAEIHEIAEEFQEEHKLQEQFDLDNHILREFNLAVHDYPERNIETAKRYINEAKAALVNSEELFQAEHYKESFAHAKLSVKLSNYALKGKYLTLSVKKRQAVVKARNKIELKLRSEERPAKIPEIAKRNLEKLPPKLDRRIRQSSE